MERSSDRIRQLRRGCITPSPMGPSCDSVRSWVTVRGKLAVGIPAQMRPLNNPAPRNSTINTRGCIRAWYFCAVEVSSWKYLSDLVLEVPGDNSLHSRRWVSTMKVKMATRIRAWGGIFAKRSSPGTLICRIGDTESLWPFQDLVEILSPMAQADLSARETGCNLRWNLRQSGIQSNSDDSKIGNLGWQERKQEVSAAELVEPAYFIL